MPIYKRSGKRPKPWYYQVMREGRIYKRSFATANEARNAEARLLAELQIRTTHIIFSVIVNKRLDYVQAYCTPRHYTDHRTMLKRFAAWRDMSIEDITPALIREKLIELSKELGNHNANRHLIALKACFSLAVNDGLLARNPCQGIRPFPTEKAPKFIPSPDDVAKVLLLAEPLDQAYLTILRYTGARVRELNNLTWEDVDWQGKQIRFYTRKKRHGHKSPRWVPMNDRVISALAHAWEKRDKRSPFVFTNPRSKQAYDYRDKFLKTLCRKAGVRPFNFHDLRHLYASELADRQTPIPRIKEFLGHENITTTSIYLQSLGKAI